MGFYFWEIVIIRNQITHFNFLSLSAVWANQLVARHGESEALYLEGYVGNFHMDRVGKRTKLKRTLTNGDAIRVTWIYRSCWTVCADTCMDTFLWKAQTFLWFMGSAVHPISCSRAHQMALDFVQCIALIAGLWLSKKYQVEIQKKDGRHLHGSICSELNGRSPPDR